MHFFKNDVIQSLHGKNEGRPRGRAAAFSSGSLGSRFWLLKNKHEIVCGEIQPLFQDDAAIVRGLFDVPDVLKPPPGNPGFAKALVESFVGRGREAASHFEGAVYCGDSPGLQSSRRYLRKSICGGDRGKMEHIDGKDDIVKPRPIGPGAGLREIDPQWFGHIRISRARAVRPDYFEYVHVAVGWLEPYARKMLSEIVDVSPASARKF